MVLTQQNVDLSLRQKPRIDYTLYSKQSSKKYIYSTRFRVFAVSAQNRNQTSIQINNQKKNHELSIQYSKPGENSASEQDSKQRPKPFQNISDMMVQFFKNRKSFERKFEELFEKSFQLEIDEQLEKLEQIFQPLGLVFGSSYLLELACELSGYDTASFPLAPAIIGGGVGLWFAVLYRFGLVRVWNSPKKQLNVIITGGTKGIGKAMAREFLISGDNVCITSRTKQSVRGAVNLLRNELDLTSEIIGIECDITSPAQVSRLADLAQTHFGHVDVWINNAGYSGGFQTIFEIDEETTETVVRTNLFGTILATKTALKLLQSQKFHRGHIFNMDGAGADGSPTPMYSVYGSTKAGISNISKTLQNEIEGKKVGIHTLSPGMVLTNLLLEGATISNKQIFNVLCEQPETVAAYLVPRVRSVVARNESGSYIKFLTVFNVIWRFLSAPSRVGRFFDAEGNPTFQNEQERLQGRKSKVTARLASKFRTRDSNLGVVYSFSLAISYVIIISYGMLDKVG